MPVNQRSRRLMLASVGLLTVASLGSLMLGRYAISGATLFRWAEMLMGAESMPEQRFALLNAVILDSRLPRVCAAVMVGAGLSVAGAAFQAVFRNPLVSPGLLGVLNGCAFGASLGIVFNVGSVGTPLLACATGLIAVAVGVMIARVMRSDSILMLILGGIISNALFAGLLSVVKYIADPQDQLPGIVFWLLGSLSAVSLPLLYVMAPVLAVAIILLVLLGRVLDVVSLSDDEAYSLGIPVNYVRYFVITLATLISALTVSLAGVVGWVGLLIPHVARLLIGASNRWILPLSATLGGLFLLISDGLARTLTASEIPLGVVTELLGAIAFLFLIGRIRQGA